MEQQLPLPITILRPPFTTGDFERRGRYVGLGEINFVHSPGGYVTALAPCIGIIAYSLQSLAQNKAVIGHLFHPINPDREDASAYPARTSVKKVENMLNTLGKPDEIYIHLGGGMDVVEDRQTVLDALAAMQIPSDHIDSRWTETDEGLDMQMRLGIQKGIIYTYLPLG